MADQETIKVESLSATPLQPVENQEETTEVPAEVTPELTEGFATPTETPETSQPSAGFVDQNIRPSDPATVEQELQQEAEKGVEVTIYPGDFDPNQVAPEASVEQPLGMAPTAGFDTSQVRAAGVPTANPGVTPVGQAPLIPPGRFVDRTRGVELSDEEFLNIKKETADFYKNQILSGNLPEGSSLENRLEKINSASFYRIPQVDEKGMPVQDEQGNFKYLSKPIPLAFNDEDGRVLQLFELASSNNGVYHLFEGDANSPQLTAHIDIGLQQMQRDEQDWFSSYFWRVENEKGGMANYIDVLKQAGIKDPARLTYLARAQAQAGPFSGPESYRVTGNVQDMVKFFADIGLGNGIQVPGTDISLGLGRPMEELTASIPFYLYEAFALNESFDPFVESTPYTNLRKSDVNKVLAKIYRGNISPLELESAADALKKQYPHATQASVDAILAYSPDLATTLKRFAVESIATSGTIYSGMRALASSERKRFIDHVRGLTGADTKDMKNLADALAELEAKGLNSTTVLKDYYEKQGLSGAASEAVSKALDLDLQRAALKPGPYYDKVIKPKYDATEKALAETQEKLKAAREQGRSPKLVESLEAQVSNYKQTLLEYNSSSYISPTVRNYLVDEGIATTAAAVGYQLVYNAAGENPTTSSLAAFAFAVSTAFPSVRDVARYGFEDIKMSLTSDLDPEVSKAAVKIRRHLEKAPEELRESILAFMEKKAVAVEELSALKFPEGHPRAGQPVVPEDALDESFANMSGLITLRKLEKELSQQNLNIQKDAGKLSKNLLELEKNFLQQSKLVDAMATHIDSLRYFQLSPNYNPNSESGIFTQTLISFYDQSKISLDDRLSDLQKATDAVQTDMNKFFSGQLPLDDMEGLLDGTEDLADLLTFQYSRYAELGQRRQNEDFRSSVEEVQDFYVYVNRKVTESMEANARFTFDADRNSQTANNQFRTWVTKEETRAYQEASAKFNQLRANPLYKDARMDLSDVVDQFIKQGPEGGLGINTLALKNIMPIYGEGTQTSRYMRNLNLPSRTMNAITSLFREASAEYIEDLSRRIGNDKVEAILVDKEVADASKLDQWFAIKEFFEENRASFGDNYDELFPRLGVAPDTFMHVVSALGRSGAAKDGLAHRQLRADLLDKAGTSFYGNFYAPKSERRPVEGFADDYEKARRYYTERYITPFREESSVVSNIVRSPDSKIRRNAFDAFMKEMGAADEATDVVKLQENFFKSLRSVTGGPIDVNSDVGKQIRAILTNYAQAEIARTPGSKALQAYLIRDYGTGEVIGPTGTEIVVKSPLVNPAKAFEIERELKKGISTATPILDNLLRRDPRDPNKFLFSDDNGQPLIDPSVANLNSFDDMIGLGVQEAQRAAVTVQERVKSIADDLVTDAGNRNSKLGGELDARMNLVRGLDASDDLGATLLNVTKSSGGLEKLAQMRQDYIYARVTEEVGEVGTKSSQEVSARASAAFDQAVSEATLEHLMGKVMEPGPVLPSRTVDATTGESKAVAYQGSEINVQALAEVLGLRGEGVTASNQEKAMRALLGTEKYDHAVFVFNTLFKFEPKTGQLNVTGTSMPLSAESMLSRGTSFARGVISLRWLVSEAAIRSSREANYQLTKLMLGSPEVGREVLDMVTKREFDLSQREPEFLAVLLSEIAKFDALQRYALEGERQELDLGNISRDLSTTRQTVENQMDSLLLSN